jgi:hypothetical protein
MGSLGCCGVVAERDGMEDPLVKDGVGGMLLELFEGISLVVALRCVSQRPTALREREGTLLGLQSRLELFILLPQLPYQGVLDQPCPLLTLAICCSTLF